MSELVAFVFRDQFRAPEVLNELRRRDWVWVRDLDEAVAVTVDKDGKARVQLTVDPLKCQGVGWARLWGSFLSATLFQPVTDVLVEATAGLSFIPNGNGKPVRESYKWSPETEWWCDSLAGSGNFKRDVASLIAPNGSVLFMLFRAQNAAAVLTQLRNYGDTLVHTTLSSEQDDKLREMLAIRRESRT